MNPRPCFGVTVVRNGGEDVIFHLVGRDDWVAAGSGVAGYRPASLAVEGFVHFSTLEQVVETANRFYAGHDDLLLLVVDPSKLTAELRWEPPADPPGRNPGGSDRGGELFPHLYGPIDADAVVAVHPFLRHPSGEFTAVPDIANISRRAQRERRRA